VNQIQVYVQRNSTHEIQFQKREESIRTLQDASFYFYYICKSLLLSSCSVLVCVTTEHGKAHMHWAWLLCREAWALPLQAPKDRSKYQQLPPLTRHTEPKYISKNSAGPCDAFSASTCRSTAGPTVMVAAGGSGPPMIPLDRDTGSQRTFFTR
jgi:hypothetical protein